MNKTKIEWTDYTWNPVTGCKHGCAYCYARAIAHRFGRSFEPTLHLDRLDRPMFPQGKKIFVCSMADLFGEWVPQEWIDRVLTATRNAGPGCCIFQFLTKNPERLVGQDWHDGCWVGATATDQRSLERAQKSLRKVKAPVRFVSVEPMLGPCELKSWAPEWVIIGPATGPKARELRPEREWIIALTEQAHELGAKVFWKHAADEITGWSLREFPR